jgi:hypothetical protein
MSHTEADTGALIERSDVDEDLLDAADLLAGAIGAVEEGAPTQLFMLRAVLVQTEQLLKARADRIQGSQPHTAAVWLEEAAGLHASIERLFPGR